MAQQSLCRPWLLLFIIYQLIVGIEHIPPSYTCTKEEIEFQRNNLELVGIHICDPVNIWKLAQLSLPDASVFIDIGSNLGYTAATIFGFWSPGHQLNKVSLKKAIEDAIRKDITTNKKFTTTYCKDGNHLELPYICTGQPIQSTVCQFRKNITVYSFDGQEFHVNNQRNVVYHYFPHLQPNHFYNKEYTEAFGKLEFIHAAVTDEIKESEKFGYFVKDVEEGGSLVKNIKNHKNDQLNKVPLTTVDQFCQERQLKVVDVLKIDTENWDYQVIRGASETLTNRKVKLLTFECKLCTNKAWQIMFDFLNTEYSFDCYLHGVNQMTMRLTNCWDYNQRIPQPECSREFPCPAYVKQQIGVWQHHAMDGNVYCINRKLAPELNKLVDNLSLHHYANGKRGHFHKDALLSVREVLFNITDGSWRMANERHEKYYKHMYGRDMKNGKKLFEERYWTPPN